MNILDNELVRKYFGCKETNCNAWHHDNGWGDRCQAYRVLQAMGTPMLQGERYLGITCSGMVTEYVFGENNPNWEGQVEASDFHGYSLRLPDAFQKRQCGCSRPHAWPEGFVNDTVEEKIASKTKYEGVSMWTDAELWDLVNLKKESK